MKSPIIETWENNINEGSRVNEHIIFAGEHQRRAPENEESFNEFYGHRHVSPFFSAHKNADMKINRFPAVSCSKPINLLIMLTQENQAWIIESRKKILGTNVNVFSSPARPSKQKIESVDTEKGNTKETLIKKDPCNVIHDPNSGRNICWV